jgi:predicted RNA-binding Zn-ribbon protein involved in translation (DUF1610 family)
MHEDDLTMPFCASCHEAFVARGDADDRHWECPACGTALR